MLNTTQTVEVILDGWRRLPSGLLVSTVTVIRLAPK